MSVIHMQSCLHSDSPPAKSSPLCNWKRETFGTKRQEGTWHCHLMVGAVNQSRGHLGSFLLLSDVGYSIHYCNLRAVAFFRAEEMHRHVTVNKHQRFKTCKTHICFPYILPLSLTIKHLREQNFHVKKKTTHHHSKGKAKPWTNVRIWQSWNHQKDDRGLLKNFLSKYFWGIFPLLVFFL